MNQKTLIYIILSAILLYLYYKRGSIAIFVAFAVVTAGTLFSGNPMSEGFSFGGGKKKKSVSGSGSGRKCANLGFAEVKIEKQTIQQNLKTLNNNFVKTISKYGVPDERGVIKLNEKSEKILKSFSSEEKVEIQSTIQNSLKENKDLFTYMVIASILLINKYTQKDGKMVFNVFGQEKQVKAQIKEWSNIQPKDDKNGYKQAINGGSKLLEMFKELKTLDDIKNGTKEEKAFIDFITCGVQHTIDVLTKLDSVIESDGVDGDDDGGDGDGGDGDGGGDGGDGDKDGGDGGDDE